MRKLWQLSTLFCDSIEFFVKKKKKNVSKFVIMLQFRRGVSYIHYSFVAKLINAFYTVWQYLTALHTLFTIFTFYCWIIWIIQISCIFVGQIRKSVAIVSIVQTLILFSLNLLRIQDHEWLIIKFFFRKSKCNRTRIHIKTGIFRNIFGIFLFFWNIFVFTHFICLTYLFIK